MSLPISVSPPPIPRQLVTMDKKIIREFPESATLLTDFNSQISIS